MSRVYLMEITGGVGDTVLGPRRTLVSVGDTTEFIGTIRMLALKDIIDAIERKEVSEDQQADLLRSLKVRLVDTGLTEFPETAEGQAELYARMVSGEPEQKLLPDYTKDAL